jgi:hypothetical protein
VGEFIEEPADALVDDGGVVSAGFLYEGAGEPGFANAAGAGDHQVPTFFDPAARGELLEERFIQLPGRPVVNVLNGGAHAGLEAFGGAVGDFTVDQERQPFGVVKFVGGVLGLRFGKGVGHAGELQIFELAECWVVEHNVFSLSGNKRDRGYWRG